jgi:hypothetical protein
MSMKCFTIFIYKLPVIRTIELTIKEYRAKNNIKLPVQFSDSMSGPIVRNNPMLCTRISEMLPWLIFIGYCSVGSMIIFHERLNELNKSGKGVSFKGKDRVSTQISSRYRFVAFKASSICLMQESSCLEQFTLDRVRIVSYKYASNSCSLSPF